MISTIMMANSTVSWNDNLEYNMYCKTIRRKIRIPMKPTFFSWHVWCVHIVIMLLWKEKNLSEFYTQWRIACVAAFTHLSPSEHPVPCTKDPTMTFYCEIMLLLACLLLCLVFVVSCRHAINPTVHLLPAAQQRVERTTSTIAQQEPLSFFLFLSPKSTTRKIRFGFHHRYSLDGYDNDNDDKY